MRAVPGGRCRLYQKTGPEAAAFVAATAAVAVAVESTPHSVHGGESTLLD